MDEPEKEKCQRCGESDHDRRTLWMACLYEMNELGIPFRELQLRGSAAYKNGTKPSPFGGSVPVFNDHGDEKRNRSFYTLRVCKNCRADWLDAQKRWFRSPPTVDDSPTGTYTRHLGTTRPLDEAT